MFPRLDIPTKCPGCARSDRHRVVARLKERARFRGVAQLYACSCSCGAHFKHSILDVSCQAAPIDGLRGFFKDAKAAHETKEISLTRRDAAGAWVQPADRPDVLDRRRLPLACARIPLATLSYGLVFLFLMFIVSLILGHRATPID